MKYRRLLAVDPSLTCSGWALISLSNRRLMGIGKIKSLPPSHTLSERLKDLQVKIFTLLKELNLSNADVLVCESATTLVDPKATFKLEQVRTIFETLARSNGTLVPGRINPHSVHREVLGMKGAQLNRKIIKLMAADTACKLYQKDLLALGFVDKETKRAKHQDIVDAILLAHLGLTRIESAVRTNESLEMVFSEVSDRKRFARKVLRAKVA